MERITIDTVRGRAQGVNRRLIAGHVHRHVRVEQRNGHVALDEYQNGGGCIRTITVGTKREVAEFLHAMMVGIDLSRGQ